MPGGDVAPRTAEPPEGGAAADAVQRFLADPAARADPGALYRAVHAAGGRLRLAWGGWVLGTADDMVRVLSSPDVVVPRLPHPSAAVEALLVRMPSLTDGPRHRDLRRVVQPVFTPGAAEAHEDLVRDAARRVVAGAVDAAGGGPVDVVAGIGEPLPLAVQRSLLGLDGGTGDGDSGVELAQLDRWTRVLTAELLRPPGQLAGLAEAEAELAAFAAVVRVRLAAVAGRGDRTLAGRIADAVRDPDDAVSLVLLLAVSGRETVTALVGSVVLALVRDPDLQEAVRSDPSRLAGVVEEVARLSPPIQVLARRAVAPLDLGGGDRIEPGDTVLVLVGAACRDPARLADAERLDPGREPLRLAFGAGPHHCLGHAYARLEVRHAAAALLDVGVLRAAEALPPPWRAPLPFSGPDRLLVTVG